MDTTGLIVVAAVLVLGTVAGLWRRRTDGRFRSATGPALSGPGGLPALRDLPGEHVFRMSHGGPAPAAPGDLASAGPGEVASARSGDLASAGPVEVASARSGDLAPARSGGLSADAHGGHGRAAGDPGAAGALIDPALLDRLGVQPAQATLLQFSSAFCAPCRAVRRVSSEVADLLPGVRHVEVDAESHLDAVRALGIWRTPTLLVLDADGRVAKRATGVPGKAQLIAVLGDLLPAAPR